MIKYEDLKEIAIKYEFSCRNCFVCDENLRKSEIYVSFRKRGLCLKHKNTEIEAEKSFVEKTIQKDQYWLEF